MTRSSNKTILFSAFLATLVSAGNKHHHDDNPANAPAPVQPPPVTFGAPATPVPGSGDYLSQYIAANPESTQYLGSGPVDQSQPAAVPPPPPAPVPAPVPVPAAPVPVPGGPVGAQFNAGSYNAPPPPPSSYQAPSPTTIDAAPIAGPSTPGSYGVPGLGPQDAVYQTPSGQYVAQQPAIQAYGADSVVASASSTSTTVQANIAPSYTAPAPAYGQQAPIVSPSSYPEQAPIAAPSPPAYNNAYGAPPPPPPSSQVAPIADIPPPQTPSYQAPAPSYGSPIPPPPPPPPTTTQLPEIIPPAPGPIPTPPCTEEGPAPAPYETAAPQIGGYTPPTLTSEAIITSQTQVVVDQGPVPGGLYGSSSTETQAPSIYANGADAAAAKISAMAGFAFMALVL